MRATRNAQKLIRFYEDMLDFKTSEIKRGTETHAGASRYFLGLATSMYLIDYITAKEYAYINRATSYILPIENWNE